MSIKIDIRKLSEIHDTQPTFLSIYADLTKNHESFMEHRESEIDKALASNPELRKNFRQNLEKSFSYLRKNAKKLKNEGNKGIAIFNSDSMDFFEVQPLANSIENSMTLDSSPYIRPLAKFLEEYEDFGIILIDHNHARIYLVKAGEIAKKERMHEDIFHHHKKGGWSQMRFQRKRQGELVHFYKDAAENAEKVFKGENIHRIIVAGQKKKKKNFIPYLSKHYRDIIIAVLNMETETHDNEVIRNAFPIFFEKERQDEKELVEKLIGAVIKGENGAYGIQDVLEKTKNGQSETILINMDYKETGYKCEKCNIVELKPGKCDYCSGNLSQVDAVEELVEWGQQTDADVEFVKDNESLESLGNVGALLRW